MELFNIIWDLGGYSSLQDPFVLASLQTLSESVEILASLDITGYVKGAGLSL